jgi:hypothetical protein
MDNIKGMSITFKIMFDGDYDREKRIELMDSLENEVTSIIENHKELVSVGGKGEWIYDKTKEISDMINAEIELNQNTDRSKFGKMIIE